ncbi:MAG: arsenate reductase ArsC [Deltaproteobacteria bacterium]|nr:arsenate reductase ArsC [Deltaproteobacteria bacterium]
MTAIPVKRKRVLFICTHNIARSQMAEGLLRAFYGDAFEVFSAGTEPGILNPFCVKAMAEIGVDISGHKPKRVSAVANIGFDFVVTLCDQAREACPYIPGAHKMIHKGFDNPSLLTGPDEEILTEIRRIRDEIRAWIETEFIGTGLSD